MDFWKMNGAGNDFLLLRDLDRAIPDALLPALARRVCERRFCLGADGMMVIRPPEGDGDFKMLFFNSDGSESEMCGNGARCVCRYGYETGLAPRDKQRVETTAGLVAGYYVDGRQWRVRLNDPGVLELSRTVELDGMTFECAYIELGAPGIPHAVLSAEGLRELSPEELRPIARGLRFHAAFPRGANINFCEITAPGRLFLRTYERGVEDFTYACGTGTGAAVLALYLQGRLPASADAEMRGGTLHVDVEAENGCVRNLWLTGPTNVAAKGELTDDAVAALLQTKAVDCETIIQDEIQYPEGNSIRF